MNGKYGLMSIFRPPLPNGCRNIPAFPSSLLLSFLFIILAILDIYERVKKHGKVIIVSKATDFSELISRFGAPPKLINIRIGNCDNRTLWEFLKPGIKQTIALLSSSDVDIVEFD